MPRPGMDPGHLDVDRGLAFAGRAEGSGVVPGVTDPLAAIRSLPALATPDGSAILVLCNFHRFLGSPEVVQRSTPSSPQANRPGPSS